MFRVLLLPLLFLPLFCLDFQQTTPISAGAIGYHFVVLEGAILCLFLWSFIIADFERFFWLILGAHYGDDFWSPILEPFLWRFF